jgi:Putative Actinobacterial Holin-X, holin superfamily III
MAPEDAIRHRQHSRENDNGAGATPNWYTLLERMVEDVARIFQLEVRLLESRIEPSLTAMVDRALAGLVVLFASAVGGGCLLTALIMLLHQWLQWWQSLAIGGGVAIAAGAIAYAGLKSLRAAD